MAKFCLWVKAKPLKKALATFSSRCRKIKCHLSRLQKRRGCESGLIVNFPLSFTAALQGSLSMKRGTGCCSKLSQTWVPQASLWHRIPITLWQTTLSESCRTFSSEGSLAGGEQFSELKQADDGGSREFCSVMRSMLLATHTCTLKYTWDGRCHEGVLVHSPKVRDGWLANTILLWWCPTGTSYWDLFESLSLLPVH